MTSSSPAIVAAALFAAAGWLAVLAIRVESRQVLVARVGGLVEPRAERPLGPAVTSFLAGAPGRILLAIAGGVVGTALGGPPVGIVAGVAAWFGPVVVRRHAAARQADRRDAELADAMTAIAAALRAGLSLSQALEFSAGEAEPPLAGELRRVVDRERLGLPLDRSIDEWGADGGPNVRLAASVLQLHHRIGGDSPIVLDQAAATLRSRRATERELQSLTAQARLSGGVLALLPVGFFLFMSIVSKGDLAASLGTPLGLAAIVAGLVLDGGAYLWIRRILAAPLR